MSFKTIIIALTLCLIVDTVAEPNYTSTSTSTSINCPLSSQNTPHWILNKVKFIRASCLTKTGTRLPLTKDGEKCGDNSACPLGKSCSMFGWCGTGGYYSTTEQSEYTCGVEIPSIVDYTIEITTKIISYTVLGGLTLFCGLFTLVSSLVLFLRTVKWFYISDLKSLFN